MSIEAQLKERLTASIRAKDLRTANVIRMVNTKVMERRTAKGFKGEVDDALYVEVIGAYRKSLAKALEQYKELGERGAAHVEELTFELGVLDDYLPKAMTEDELRAAVQAAIDATGTTDPKQAGKLIGAVMKDHKGRVEAGDVRGMALKLLGGS